jgi:hypothetical protein
MDTKKPLESTNENPEVQPARSINPTAPSLADSLTLSPELESYFDTLPEKRCCGLH